MSSKPIIKTCSAMLLAGGGEELHVPARSSLCCRAKSSCAFGPRHMPHQNLRRSKLHKAVPRPNLRRSKLHKAIPLPRSVQWHPDDKFVVGEQSLLRLPAELMVCSEYIVAAEVWLEPVHDRHKWVKSIQFYRTSTLTF